MGYLGIKFHTEHNWEQLPLNHGSAAPWHCSSQRGLRSLMLSQFPFLCVWCALPSTNPWCSKVHEDLSCVFLFLWIEMGMWRAFSICKVKSLSSGKFSDAFSFNISSLLFVESKNLPDSYPTTCPLLLFFSFLKIPWFWFLGSTPSIFSLSLFLLVWVFPILETFLKCPVILGWMTISEFNSKQLIGSSLWGRVCRLTLEGGREARSQAISRKILITPPVASQFLLYL